MLPFNDDEICAFDVGATEGVAEELLLVTPRGILAQSFKGRAAEKQIRLEAPANPGPVRVRADRLLLYQALSNLVTNAIKYSPSGTTVRFRP